MVSAASTPPVPRLDVAAVVAQAGRHEVTIRRALESGRLHGTQLVKGGRWRVRQDCLDAWLDGVDCAHQVSQRGRVVIPITSARGRAS